MDPTVHTITIPSSTRHLEEVRRFVKSYAVEAGFSPRQINHVQMAVDEACANIIEHAYEGDETQWLDVEVSVDPDRLVVSIRDRGVPFDLDAYSEPDVQELVEQRQSGGLGVYLIHQLMDEVEYRRTGLINEVRLVKRTNDTNAT